MKGDYNVLVDGSQETCRSFRKSLLSAKWRCPLQGGFRTLAVIRYGLKEYILLTTNKLMGKYTILAGIQMCLTVKTVPFVHHHGENMA